MQFADNGGTGRVGRLFVLPLALFSSSIPCLFFEGRERRQRGERSQTDNENDWQPGRAAL